MFPQLFMLGDVDVHWGVADADMPSGHLLRWVRIEEDGDFTGMLVCVPLKGRSRYRIATLAPTRLQKTIGSGVKLAAVAQRWADASNPNGLAMQCGARLTPWYSAIEAIRFPSRSPPHFWISGAM